MFATKDGLIKKTPVSEFSHINKNGKIAISLKEGDELISTHYTTGDNEIIVASKFGKCIHFHESDVRSMGRDTSGVRAMTLNEGDDLVDMLVVDPEKDLLTVTENGYGKRSDLKDYRLQSRAGKGIKAGIFNETTGNLVNLKQVSANDDIMIITDLGTIIRMHCDAISTIGRTTKGVRLMRIKGGVVATVAVTERDNEAETEAPEQTADDLSPEELAQETDNKDEE